MDEEWNRGKSNYVNKNNARLDFINWQTFIQLEVLSKWMEKSFINRLRVRHFGVLSSLTSFEID